MKSCKIILFLFLCFVSYYIYSCKTEEITLHGEISGIVTDTITGEPIQSATIILNESTYVAKSLNDGTYLLKNLQPGNYQIKTFKSRYLTASKIKTVTSAEIQNVNFSLTPLPKFSQYFLDFGQDSTTLKFTISYYGNTKMTYVFTKSQEWINVSPPSGDINNGTDTITVIINKTGLSDNLYKEFVKVISTTNQFIIADTINVFLNGVVDSDGNAYPVVKIGTQTWLGENLNTGIKITSSKLQEDNGIIEKYCYLNDESNCKIYGGLYQWNEMMQYAASDTGTIGTTIGICPTGWHIPTFKEWKTLFDYLGEGADITGKLKESGTAHWYQNPGATNETGFTALPGGIGIYERIYTEGYGWITLPLAFKDILKNGYWWSSTTASFYPDYAHDLVINWDKVPKVLNQVHKESGASVRCIKDSPKNK